MVFIERYLLHWNAAKAALEAGYCIQHPDSSKLAAYEMLHKPYIRKAIDDRMQMVCMETNEALGRLAAIARGDIMNYLSKDEYGIYQVDLDKAEKLGVSFLIKSYTITREGPMIELYSAAEALDRIAKHLNILKQPEVEVNVSLTAWALFVQKAKQESGIDLNAPQLQVARSQDRTESPDADSDVIDSTAKDTTDQ
jgi:hypothetical protein